MNVVSVKEIIATALKESNQKADLKEEWDSLAHISILVALDTAFEGKINQIEELQSAYSVDSIVGILRERNFIE